MVSIGGIVGIVTLLVRVHEIHILSPTIFQRKLFGPVVVGGVHVTEEIIETTGRGEVPWRFVAEIPFAVHVGGVSGLLESVRDGGLVEVQTARFRGALFVFLPSNTGKMIARQTRKERNHQMRELEGGRDDKKGEF